MSTKTSIGDKVMRVVQALEWVDNKVYKAKENIEHKVTFRDELYLALAGNPAMIVTATDDDGNVFFDQEATAYRIIVAEETLIACIDSNKKAE